MRRFIALLLLGAAVPAAAQDMPESGVDYSAPPPGAAGDAPPGPARAAASIDIAPYIEVDQVVLAELSPGSDVVTYTEIAAGIDASIQRRNVEGQISYRYERRFAWNEGIADDDVHSGLARASIGLGRSFTLEGGALATRTRAGLGSGPLFDFGGRQDETTNLFALYAGPSFQRRFGDLDISGAYRFGYTKVEAPDVFDEVEGRAFDLYDDSTIHLVQGSIGMPARGSRPFGWTISGAGVREDQDQLEQRYRGWFVRGDVVVPLSPTLAAVGGVGWEDIEATQRAPLVDAEGDPVLDGDGRFVTDPNSPRLVAYAEDALFWDVGVLWRPTPRSSLELRVGERYSSLSVTGSLQWQVGRRTALQIGIYDSVDSFGRRLTSDIDDLPTRFRSQRDSFSGGFSGCVFGVGEGQAGGCLTSTLAAIATANYRTRGVDAVLSSGAGRWNYGVGAGYAHRRYFAPDLGPGITVFGIEDRNLYLQGYLQRELSPRSSIDGQVYTNWYGAEGAVAVADVVSTGAIGSYNYSFGRFDATGSLGLQAFRQDSLEEFIEASARLGLRYNF